MKEPSGNTAALILGCWTADWMSGDGCAVPGADTAFVDGPCQESAKGHLAVIIFMRKTHRIKTKGVFQQQISWDMTPTLGSEKVNLFIVAKQWLIIFAQHKRCICSSGWKVEYSSDFFPSSLLNYLRIGLWKYEYSRIKHCTLDQHWKKLTETFWLRNS